MHFDAESLHIVLVILLQARGVCFVAVHARLRALVELFSEAPLVFLTLGCPPPNHQCRATLALIGSEVPVSRELIDEFMKF